MTTPGTPQPRSRARAGLLLGAAFVLGIIVGALGGGYAHHRFEHRFRGRPTPDMFVHRMTRDLKLTPVQQDSVRAVLKRRQPEMDSLWRSVRPRVETLRNSIRSEIRQQLTADQQARFDKQMRRFDAMHRPPGPDPMGPPQPPPEPPR